MSFPLNGSVLLSGIKQFLFGNFTSVPYYQRVIVFSLRVNLTFKRDSKKEALLLLVSFCK